MTMVNCVRLSTAGGRERERGHAILDACAAGGNSTAGRCSGVHAESRVQHGRQQFEWQVDEDFENRIQQPMFHIAPIIYICVLEIDSQQQNIT
jgi:hypothetical protein